MIDSTLARARAGDGDAFAELVSPYRRELHVHCYRILGSFHDAEDVLQETLVAAWSALQRFDGRNLRAWLYRIATNRCLNHRRDASRQPPVVYPPAASSPFANAARSNDPWWLEPYPDALTVDVELSPEARYDTRESIALSFVAALQHLPSQQRAALVLRDVLGLSAADAADVLESTPASINSAVQRARAGFRPAEGLERVHLPRSKDEAAVVDRFVDAFERGDVPGVVTLLTADVTATMPPEPYEFRGRPTVADHLRHTHDYWGQGLWLVRTNANNQPAFGYYLPDPSADVYRGVGILVLGLSEGQIASMTRFSDERHLALFGLPHTVPRAAHADRRRSQPT